MLAAGSQLVRRTSAAAMRPVPAAGATAAEVDHAAALCQSLFILFRRGMQGRPTPQATSFATMSAGCLPNALQLALRVQLSGVGGANCKALMRGIDGGVSPFVGHANRSYQRSARGLAIHTSEATAAAAAIAVKRGMGMPVQAALQPVKCTFSNTASRGSLSGSLAAAMASFTSVTRQGMSSWTVAAAAAAAAASRSAAVMRPIAQQGCASVAAALRPRPAGHLLRSVQPNKLASLQQVSLLSWPLPDYDYASEH